MLSTIFLRSKRSSMRRAPAAPKRWRNEERFDLKKMVESIEGVYEECLCKK